MSADENEAIVRRIYDELWNERKLEAAVIIWTVPFISSGPNGIGTSPVS